MRNENKEKNTHTYHHHHRRCHKRQHPIIQRNTNNTASSFTSLGVCVFGVIMETKHKQLSDFLVNFTDRPTAEDVKKTHAFPINKQKNENNKHLNGQGWVIYIVSKWNMIEAESEKNMLISNCEPICISSFVINILLTEIIIITMFNWRARLARCFDYQQSNRYASAQRAG